MPAPRLGHVTVASTLVWVAVLLLLTARCGTRPGPASPSALSSPPSDGGSWVVPEVPLAAPRTVVLLQPPPEGPDAAALTATAPDPAPLVEAKQWVYDLRYDKGEVYLVGVRALTLPEARPTPRVMGRFALELYSGPTLIERVRFDFPGLGVAERTPPTRGNDGRVVPLKTAPFSFTAKLTTRVGVMLPATVRGTKLELWDRATDRRWPLPWPAVETGSAAP